jgi:flagellin
MAFSIQTNVNSLVAQENLRVNSNFQSQTIQRLTSGYRITSSADDAAGLAVANKFRSDVSELAQGVRNANDGVSTLQIIDGGMNNIGKMLDRLKTLAAQSASDSFTGDRNIANDEFKSLLTEIDRQAQAVGLNQNGQFAKSLQVFVGGGKTHGLGEVSVDNGTVTVDLGASSVDTTSLGLKGMQLVAGTTDIGGANSPANIAQILGAGNDTTGSDITSFYFSGAGFSGANKIKVEVNTESVIDIDTLASAFNSGIAAAAAEDDAASIAFKEAGVTVSVNTTSDGKKQLAFTSVSAAFQVQAGDQLANAFMGNLQAGTALGEAITGTTVTGGAVAANVDGFSSTVTMRFTGAGIEDATDPTKNYKDFTLAAAADVGAAITALKAAIAADATMQAAGISLDEGNTRVDTGALVFSSAKGEKFDVQVTGDVSNQFGLGAFQRGAGTTVVDYRSIDGATNGYDWSADSGNAVFQFSINGGESATNKLAAVSLTAGDAQTALVTGAVVAPPAAGGLRLTVNANNLDFGAGVLSDTMTEVVAQINNWSDTNGYGFHARMNAAGTQLTLESDAAGPASLLTIDPGSTALAALGLNAPVTNRVAGTSRTAGDLVEALNAEIAKDADLVKAGIRATQTAGGGTTATIGFESTNGTNFRVGISGSTANVGFGTAGAIADFAAADYTATVAKAVVMNSGASQSTALDFTAIANGNDDQTITLSATDSTGSLKSAQVTLRNDETARTGRSVDEAVTEINRVLASSNAAVLRNIVAVKDVNASGVEKINFLSSDNSFKIDLAQTPNSAGLQGLSGGTEVDSTELNSANVSIDTKASAQSAVVAITNAVKALGTAQAAVGKGQNQLNYAIGLAQSQISNFSAAESRIRDADVASEAANLTKASVLQQASIAAMAQANSAPQAVLSLLRG